MWQSKSFTKCLFLTLFSLVIVSCSSGGSDEDSADSLRAALDPSINLRLGTSDNGASPIVTSAALENGESIIIIQREEGEVTNFDVIYTNASGQSVMITYDPSGRPTIADTGDASINFSNYKERTVDVSLRSQGRERAFQTIDIPEEAIGILGGGVTLASLLGVDQDADGTTRSVLAAALSAVRIFGCIGVSIAPGFQSFENFVPNIFQGTSNSACSSSLLSSISNNLQRTNFAAITVRNIPDVSACNRTSNYNNAASCGVNFGNRVVESSRRGTTGNFPQEQSTGGGGPDFTQTWFGEFIPDVFGFRCETGTVIMDVNSQGDNSCKNTECSVVGDFITQTDVGNFTGNFGQANGLSIVVDDTVSGDSGTANGNLSGNDTGIATYASMNGCTGTITFDRNFRPAPPSPFRGNWDGIMTATSPCAPTGTVNFTITSAGDDSCLTINCNVNGTFNLSPDFGIFTGDIDHNGTLNYVLTFNSSADMGTGHITMTDAATGNSSDLNTVFGCNGTMNVTLTNPAAP